MSACTHGPPIYKATIPSCSQMLDVASGGKVVAVVREKQIELWDTAAAKKLKAAPFKHTRIDAASFSPDGKLLAISDRNELVLWRWEEDTHERDRPGAVRRVADVHAGRQVPRGRADARGKHPDPRHGNAEGRADARQRHEAVDERPADGLHARRPGADRLRQHHVNERRSPCRTASTCGTRRAVPSLTRSRCPPACRTAST